MEGLSIRNLNKTYANGVHALVNVSLDIRQGMFGLLGPNGAGKSSLMRTIATLQTADSGIVEFEGVDVCQDKNYLRRKLGFLPQEFGLYPKVSARDLLHHLAVLKGIVGKSARTRIVDELLDRVNLFSVCQQNLGGFSGGMKRRFGIAQALLNRPKLLIVDEPTAGLDPKERNRFFNVISEISEESIVLLSTHIVEDVKQLCPQLAIMDTGRILTQGNPTALMQPLEQKLFSKFINRDELATYESRYQIINRKMHMGSLKINIYSEKSPEPGFRAEIPTLEDAYLFHIQNLSL